MSEQSLIMTIGLPGSGKTTWAREQVANGQGKVARVNKDDLRSMVDGGAYSREREEQIISIRDEAIRHFLASGRTVIVDDTNLAPKHRQRLQQLAEEGGVGFLVQDFSDVSVAECIRRDLIRPNSVGQKVIWQMYNQFLAGADDIPIVDESKPKAVICDIDGTVAKHHRSPYDYDKLLSDTLIEPIRDALYRLAYDGQGIRDHAVLFVSGRPGERRVDTEQWLQDQSLPYQALYMRPLADDRPDSIVKMEIYRDFIQPYYSVSWVLDDRDRVVSMWRSLGTDLSAGRGRSILRRGHEVYLLLGA